MGNVVARYENGPLTFECGANVTGGKFVKSNGSGKVVHAAAVTDVVLGVALYDAVVAGTSNVGTTSYGATVVDVSQPQPDVAVAFKGVFKLTNSSASALALGDAVGVSTSGDVQAAGANAVIGQVVEPGGIAAGAKGLIRLSL